MHGFADASEDAYGAVVYSRYGAVVYFRAKDFTGNVQITYIMAKTRVAPLKVISVALLELKAAHCLAKLTRYVTDAINNELKFDRICLWSDSKIAPSWIAKPSSHWKTFVRNGVQEIHDLTSPNAWSNCPGTENPADLHSWGMSLKELKDSDIYW